MSGRLSLAGQKIEFARRMLTARFQAASIDAAELDARTLIGGALGLDLTGLVGAAARALSEVEAERLEDFARRRLAGEPVARFAPNTKPEELEKPIEKLL